MPRHPEPRFYPSRGAWYVQVGGRKILLAKGKARKAEAQRAFHRLMASGEVPGRREPDVSVATLADLFLDDCQARLAPLTYEWYRRHLQSFADRYGAARAADVKPLHVARWLAGAGEGWADGTRRGAVTAVKRLFRWAKRQGHLAADALESLDRPAAGGRKAALAPGQGEAIRAAVPDREFRDLLAFLHETGARPSEAGRLEAGMIDFGRAVAVMPAKTTRRTGKPRVIQLTPAALALCRGLAADRPEGPLFRNRRGNAWTRNAMACRFARLRKKLGMGKEATAGSYRHAFATDGLAAGVPLKTVAELLGHQSAAMVERHYSHLHERLGHLRAAAEKVRPASGPEGAEQGG